MATLTPACEAAEPEITLGRSAATGSRRDRPSRRGEAGAPSRPSRTQRRRGGTGDVDRSIFRAYDIRGVRRRNADAGVARLIGRAIGSEARDRGLKEIVVGRDGRLSGPDMVGRLIEGLRSDRLRRDRHRRGADAGRCISRSYHLQHRFRRVGHRQPQSARLQRLQDRARRRNAVRRRDPGPLRAHRRGALRRAAAAACRRMDISGDYIRRIADDIQVERKLKVVVDCGNGIAGAIAPAGARRHRLRSRCRSTATSTARSRTTIRIRPTCTTCRT